MSQHEDAESRLGIVGAGKIGTAIARAAVGGGYDVAISGSGAADRIELIVEVLAPGAQAVTTEAVVRHADLIVLAVPMHRFRDLSHDLFAGKILVDAMNYWEEIDGLDEELAAAPCGTSVVVQEWFPSSRVVKSLNHLGYFKFEQGRRPRGAADRLAMAAAGNDPEAVAAVLQLIDRLGFDAVDCRVAQCRRRPAAKRAGVRCRSQCRRTVESPLARSVVRLTGAVDPPPRFGIVGGEPPCTTDSSGRPCASRSAAPTWFELAHSAGGEQPRNVMLASLLR